MGYTGQNVVVGEVDTGIWYTHLDLARHLWTSSAYPHPGFNYASHILFPTASNPSPNDTLDDIDYTIGHGTHCAGIVSADGTFGNGTHDTMGVAPSARMLVCNALVYFNGDNSGETLLEQSVLLGFQFCIRPPRDTLDGADVITTSLGVPGSYNPRYANYRAMEQSIEAAGVAHCVAAGNEGPAVQTIRTPGNCPPPWPNPANNPTDTASSAVITVGATDNGDNAASFTSIGPTVIWGNTPPYNDYVYPPGLMDPDVCAPGVDITSTFWEGDSAYTQMSGTSMATPATAGCVALMLSKNPSLTPRMVDSILECCAVKDLGPSGKDVTYGAGRIDCSLAVAFTPFPGPRHDIALTRLLAPTAKIGPDTALTPTVLMVNVGTYHETSIPVHMTIDSLGNTVYDTTVLVPSLDSVGTDTVRFPDWTPGPGGNVYDLTVWHSYSPDTDRTNDTLHSVVATRLHDMVSVSMNVSGRIQGNLPFLPALTVHSGDYTEHSITCYCRIDSSSARVYDQSAVIDSVMAGSNGSASFPVWNVGPAGTTYDVTMFNTFADQDPSDDTLRRTTEAIGQFRILIAYADVYGTPDSLTKGLTALGDSVELYDAASSTPTLALLSPYDGVISFSDNPYHDPVALGDTLAAYVDLGKPVVLGAFAVTTGFAMQGGIMTGDYATMVPGDMFYGEDTLGWYDAAHPIMEGITTTADYYRTSTGWAAGADSVATWRDGRPYVATSANMHVVAINNYPGYVNPLRLAGQWVLVYHNALFWAAGGSSGLEAKQPFSVNPDFALCQSRPNPFSDRTAIRYSVSHPLDVNLAVYDRSGRLVTTLVNGRQIAGWHNVVWNRTDDEGRRLASGVYFYRLNSGTYRTTRKLVIE
jgi:subtilisin family serine protease